MKHLAFFSLGLAVACLVAPAASAQDRFAELHRLLPADGDTTVDSAAGDLDGDGDLDLVLSNAAGTSSARALTNDGVGTLERHFDWHFADDYPTNSADLADVDNDGDLDVYFGRAAQVGSVAIGVQNRLFTNDGHANFTDATAGLPVSLDHTTAVGMADLDADGNVDVLVGNVPVFVPQLLQFKRDSLLLGNGAGGFVDAGPDALPLKSSYALKIPFADVDADGDLDAVVSRSASAGIYLYENNGSALFVDASAKLQVPSGLWGNAEVADVDGDGYDDVLAGALLLLNDGTGNFVNASNQLPSSATVAGQLAVADIDSDGDVDAVIKGSTNSPEPRLYFNDGTGVFSDHSQSLPMVPNSGRTIRIFDADGDSDGDVLFGGSGQDSLLLNDGQGELVYSDQVFGVGTCSDVELADMDGDGDRDAVFAVPVGPNRLFLNDGVGEFVPTSATLSNSSDHSRAVDLGDVDGDGDTDVVFGNAFYLDGQNRLYLNDGSGTFADATSSLPAEDFSTEDVEFGDLDLDGDLDLLAVNFGQSDPMSLYENSGAGVFVNSSHKIHGLQANDCEDVELGDFNSDGFPDIVLTTKGYVSVFANDATGEFDPVSAFLGNDGANQSVVGDVNGDNHADLVIGSDSSISRLFLGNGAFGFTNASQNLPTPFGNCNALGLVDVDGDGLLDLYVGNDDKSVNQLYLNQGAGVFSDESHQLGTNPLENTMAIAAADLDRDGDRDLLLANFSAIGGRQLVNLTRELAYRGVPRLGKIQAMDVYGPPQGGFVAGWSFGISNLPLPPFGSLLIDPASTSIFGSGILGPDGQASFAISLSPNPAWLGTSLHWQAVVGAPFQLTSRETMTFTDL